MKIKTETINGVIRYVLQSYDGSGKRRRQYFDSEKEAKASMAAKAKELDRGGKWWAGLSEGQRIDVASVAQEVFAAGRSLRDVWDSAKIAACPPPKPKGPTAPTLQQATQAMLADKRLANCAPDYLDSLEGFLRRFSAGREHARLEEITAPVLGEFLATIKHAESRKTWRAKLSSLFGWAVRRKILPSNPLNELEVIRTHSKGLPTILELEQVKAGFDFCVTKAREGNGDLLRCFTLGVMVGLRPEEAFKVSADLVKGDWETLYVSAAISKRRVARTVEIPHEARAWLRMAGEVRPTSLSTWKRNRQALRQALGLKCWPKDVLRHTAASFILAKTGDLGLVARMLGNSVAVLAKHYINPRTKAQSEAFWALSGSPQLLENGAQVKAQGASS